MSKPRGRVVVVRKRVAPTLPPAQSLLDSHYPDSVSDTPSVGMTEAELLMDPDRYVSELLWIRDKWGNVVPFKLNPVQLRLTETKRRIKAQGKPQRFLILKSRRQGVTTYEQAMAFHGVATRPNYQAVTLAHDDKSTEKIFRIANLFYDTLDPNYKPKRLAASNKRDLNFPALRSLYSIGTAGSRGVGRGDTLNKVHWSETAWSPGTKEDQRRTLAGLTEATSAGEVTLETTPNGVGDLFHEKFVEAMHGRNEWTPLFFPWFADPTYRLTLTESEAVSIMKRLTEEETKLVAKHGLDASQIAWRRIQIEELKNLFQQEYPEDWETCFLVSGQSFFDKGSINALFLECGEPVNAREDGTFIQWATPVQGRRYVCGADVAEGLKDGNRSVMGVLEVESGEQVAVVRGKWPPEEFARLCAEVAYAYNGALLAVERNNHGHSCLNTLANSIQYRELYYHKEYDATGKGLPALGWPTSPKTRPILLDDLREAVEGRFMAVRDRVLLEECRTFGPNERGRYEALNGAYDDSLFAWGIAWQVRKLSVKQGGGGLSKGYESAVNAVGAGRFYTPSSIMSVNPLSGRLY